MGFTSGPYYSDYYEFTKPLKGEKQITLNNLRYHEETIGIPAGAYWYFTIRFDEPGTKLIETMGTYDTKMWLYSSDGTSLIDSDDDSGYSLNAQIFKYLYANTTYVLKVGMCSSAVSGNVKVMFAPIYGVQDSNHTNMETYESFRNIESTNTSLYSYLTEHYSKVVRFTPPESGNYTIRLESTFDNYLYIMDPRVPTQNLSNYNYNDDTNGRNASITRYFEKGIQYLVLYSQYNPSRPFDNLDEGDDITVYFKKV